MSETTETSTPEPARDGSGAVGITGEHIEALESFVPPDTEQRRWGMGMLAKRRLRLANEAMARLRATPPAAVSEVERRSDAGGELYVRLAEIDSMTPGAFEQMGITAALHDYEATVGGHRVAYTEPTPAPAGGDVAAAVPFAALVDELHGFADARMIVPGEDPAHALETAESEALRRLAASLLAAHEAAVQAVEERAEKAERERRQAMAEFGRLLLTCSPDALATERARAEALGARVAELEGLVREAAQTTGAISDALSDTDALWRRDSSADELTDLSHRLDAAARPSAPEVGP